MTKLFNLRRFRNSSIRTVSSVLVLVLMIGSFFMASPGDLIRQGLMKIEMQKIETSNARSFSLVPIAYADYYDEYGNYVYDSSENTQSQPVCCEQVAPDYSQGQYCDSSVCQEVVYPTPICCNNGVTPNTSLGEYCNDNMCSNDDTTTTTNHYVCCDGSANNDSSGSVGSTDSSGNPIVCGDSQTYCGYDEDTTSKTPICCDTSRGGTYPPGPTQTCGNPDTYCSNNGPAVCCDGNWDNYVSPSERPSNSTCEYNPPTCSCVAHTDPFYTQNHGSQCGNGDDTITNGDQGCHITAAFSVVKSGVTISGGVDRTVPGKTDEQWLQDPTPTDCSQYGDSAYIAGLAAADATPDTPLYTPVQLDSLTTYVVTSKDYCQNISGTQPSAAGYDRSDSGVCCAAPDQLSSDGSQCITSATCGSATTMPTDNAPSSNLCEGGTPSTISEGQSSFDWTCSDGSTTASCSVTKTCNGVACGECTSDDCGQNDVCKNVQGNQTADTLSSSNLAVYGNGQCFNSTTGACGSLVYVPYTTANLNSGSANLCDSNNGAYVSNGPTYSSSTNMWSWTCATSMGGDINPPTCQVAKCSGSECQTNQATGLIASYRIQPAIVATSSDTCRLTWDANVDSSISDPAQGCRLNGQAASDKNTNGLSVHPGSYNLMCFVGEQFQSQSLKCTVTPNYSER